MVASAYTLCSETESELLGRSWMVASGGRNYSLGTRPDLRTYTHADIELKDGCGKVGNEAYLWHSVS